MKEVHIVPLGRKIVAAILGTTLLALSLATLLNMLPIAYGLRSQALERSSAQAELLAASLVASVDFADPDSAGEILSTLSLTPSVTGAAVYVDDAAPFAVYGDPPDRVETTVLTHEATFSSILIACPVSAQSPGSALTLSVSLEGQWAMFKNTAMISVVIFAAVFYVCIRAAGSFRRRLGDPIEKLTAAIREIALKKDSTRRVDYRSDDELGVMVLEFNAMLDKIESRDAQLLRHQEELEDRVEERTEQLRAKQLELVQNNQRLLEEIARRTKAEMIREEVERINRHDLKSGLSLVIGYPELLLREGGLTDRQARNVRRIRAAGYRMLDMVRNQLDIFKMEKGLYALKHDEVDLVEVVCGLEEEFHPLLERSGTKLSVQLDGREIVGVERYVVVGEHSLMRTMLRNLILNAIEASSSGDVVAVSFYDQSPGRISVSNPAIVPKEIRRRFFDKHVTQGKENGTGLGTYFAALIARTHGMDIAMKTGEEGTAVTLMLRSRSSSSEAVAQPRVRY